MNKMFFGINFIKVSENRTEEMQKMQLIKRYH
jgi:hypothetical protein